MPIDCNRIRALCFDIDGTLSDTDDLWVGKLERLVQPLHPILPGRDPHLFSRRLVMGLESPGNLLYHLLDRFKLDDEIAWIFNQLARRSRERSRPVFSISPGVKQTLQALQPLYPMSVVSARGERSTLAFLEQFSLHPFFKTVITAQTCPYTKPFPDPIYKAAQEMGVKSAECLMIGDTTVDMLAGRAAGAQTAGLLCGFGDETELRRAGADEILSAPLDLIKLLAP
ncbi:MAG: HAD family hydrolase [Anaerolineaceae bacterium]|nr:HAD family hydrolase [Anaerolineaceae bacterium]